MRWEMEEETRFRHWGLNALFSDKHLGLGHGLSVLIVCVIPTGLMTWLPVPGPIQGSYINGSRELLQAGKPSGDTSDAPSLSPSSASRGSAPPFPSTSSIPYDFSSLRHLSSLLNLLHFLYCLKSKLNASGSTKNCWSPGLIRRSQKQTPSEAVRERVNDWRKQD